MRDGTRTGSAVLTFATIHGLTFFPSLGLRFGDDARLIVRLERRRERVISSPPLAPVYEHSKVSRLGCSHGMGLLFGWSGRGIEIRCSEKNIVGLWINLQRLSSVLGLNGFNLAELVCRIFMVNVQHAFAGRYE